jgi:hypothetical protein
VASSLSKTGSLRLHADSASAALSAIGEGGDEGGEGEDALPRGGGGAPIDWAVFKTREVEPAQRALAAAAAAAVRAAAATLSVPTEPLVRAALGTSDWEVREAAMEAVGATLNEGIAELALELGTDGEGGACLARVLRSYWARALAHACAATVRLGAEPAHAGAVGGRLDDLLDLLVHQLHGGGAGLPVAHLTKTRARATAAAAELPIGGNVSDAVRAALSRATVSWPASKRAGARPDARGAGADPTETVACESAGHRSATLEPGPPGAVERGRASDALSQQRAAAQRADLGATPPCTSPRSPERALNSAASPRRPAEPRARLPAAPHANAPARSPSRGTPGDARRLGSTPSSAHGPARTFQNDPRDEMVE